MKSVSLAYGAGRLSIEVPDRVEVIEPRFVPAVAEPGAALARALASPIGCPRLRDTVRPGQTVAIAVCDGTRPQPRQPMLLALLDELQGITSDDDVVVLVATGTHRTPGPGEAAALVGADVAGRVRVVGHDGWDPSGLVWRGRLGDDVPVWLNREWCDADVRITTGFVEPHFFAGFSGGPKLVAPGLAGAETVLELHNASRIGHPRATWTVTAGNPVHDDIRAIAAATGVGFAFDVVLNRDQEITAAFAGELFSMHAAACAVATEVAVCPVGRPFDVVVTTNSGFPLDQNLYQAVKGMSAAALVVRPGGVIVSASECRHGFPDHGHFRELVTGGASPEEILATVAAAEVTVPDQWQAQVLARVLRRARVLLYADGLSASEISSSGLEPCSDVGVTLRDELARLGPGATAAVVPEGPQTVPVLAGPESSPQ